MSEARIQRKFGSSGLTYIMVQIDYDQMVGIRPSAWSCAVSIQAGPIEVYMDVTIEGEDPAQWIVNDSQTIYDRGVHPDPPRAVRLVSLSTMSEGRAVLRLSKLPEVLEVVQAAWEQAKGAQRLSERESAIEIETRDEQ